MVVYPILYGVLAPSQVRFFPGFPTLDNTSAARDMVDFLDSSLLLLAKSKEKYPDFVKITKVPRTASAILSKTWGPTNIDTTYNPKRPFCDTSRSGLGASTASYSPKTYHPMSCKKEGLKVLAKFSWASSASRISTACVRFPAWGDLSTEPAVWFVEMLKILLPSYSRINVRVICVPKRW